MSTSLLRPVFLVASALLGTLASAQDFLERPITGPKKVLFYRLAYPAADGSPSAGPLPLTTPCDTK